MQQEVISITKLNEYIQSKLDSDILLNSVALRGEISNYKMYPSGHHYFTLKDESSSLKCVMFRSNATKLRFRPENGMKIIAIGKVSVYPRDGVYQLYCSAMSMDGIGDLYAAFEALKKKLSAEGLFDPAHKKHLPKHPGTIGIITSSAGAAIHDMLRILKKRYPLTNVRLLPVRVQGIEAPAEIAAAIQYANAYQLADLLIVGRGGGSIEDLWAFNDERVAYAIYHSEIPVISAVGHEPDVTISDYVADLRAATPSNAAELAVQDQNSLRQVLDAMSAEMLAALDRQLEMSRRHLELLSRSSALRSPTGYIDQKRQGLNSLTERLTSATVQSLDQKGKRFISLTSKLDAMSPLKVLSRGYAMVQKSNGTILKSVNQVSAGDFLSVSVSDGVIKASVMEE